MKNTKGRAQKAHTKTDGRRALAVGTCSETARVLLMHAVSGVLDGCGNSYSNAYTERWLTKAKMLGAYHGRVIGNIVELKDEWEAWIDAHGGLPDF